MYSQRASVQPNMNITWILVLSNDAFDMDWNITNNSHDMLLTLSQSEPKSPSFGSFRNPRKKTGRSSSCGGAAVLIRPNFKLSVRAAVAIPQMHYHQLVHLEYAQN